MLEHIDRELDQPLALDTLAGIAHFSPFHFHRLFSAWMGETLGDYLRRRRLELAAMRLIAQPRVPVLHIALSVGFGSAEAFTCAFNARFGCSPTVWRRQNAAAAPPNSNPDQTKRNLDQVATDVSSHYGASHNRTQETSMNVKLLDRQPTTVAYLRHLGPYGAPLSRFWQDTVYPWMVSNDLLNRPRYGISHDDPGITAPEKCRYDACVEVPANFVATGKSFITTVPGGKYAAASFYGTASEIGAAWASLLRDWLPESGLQLDARPCFEYYPVDGKYDPKTGAFSCEIVVPVVPL